ncbi:unnamed protein product [Victoria cruziana]
MATESEGEEEVKQAGSPELIVDDNLWEMAKKAAGSVSSFKQGNGVLSLTDANLDTYWQSDGAQPHLLNIQFQKKVKLRVCFGCCRETFVHTFMLQTAVLSNHPNGRDTHIRQIRVYGPRPNPVLHQPFHFTSREFTMYSSVR